MQHHLQQEEDAEEEDQHHLQQDDESGEDDQHHFQQDEEEGGEDQTRPSTAFNKMMITIIAIRTCSRGI